MEKARFTRIDESTREDWLIVARYEEAYATALPDRVLDLLRRMGSDEEGQPYRITRLAHSLQTATRALRDQAEDELVVAALLHDLGDELAPHNHAEFAAAILKPYVSEQTCWIVRHHDEFQGKYFWGEIGLDPDTRDKYRDSPWFDAAEAFCRDWDCPSFDPSYDTLPLDRFEPMVRRIFAREPYSARRSTA